ncbi:hypothetical protein M0805_003385 [Coniferiporia weirii]|nr:hypothetical protein M0805_003385 [Coniferiporia weirii]
MAAPSFSSFPSIFESRREREPGPSSRSQSVYKRETVNDAVDGTKHKEKRKGDAKDINEINEREGKSKRKGHERRQKSRHGRDDGMSNHNGFRDDNRTSKHRGKQAELVGNGRDAKYLSQAKGGSEMFFQDGRGDPLNITYGGLHTGDIPRYWHIARGMKVLGLDSRLSVLYRAGKGVEVGAPEWHNRAPQLTDSHARALLAGKTHRLAASARTLLKYEESDGFIRVPSRKGKGRVQAYRSITREDAENSDSQTSSESGSSSSEYETDTSPMSAREESLRNLEQKLLRDPTSISDWLLLVEHSLNGMPATNRNVDKARSEISVSVLSRAFSAHPDNNRSTILWLKYLKAGELFWTGSKLKSEWEEALRILKSGDICVDWFDWRTRSNARLDDVLHDAARALEMAAKSTPGDGAELAELRVFWRIVIFLKQSGYVERAFAIFQAQAELSFNMPENVKHLAFEEQLNHLEEFWECEAARTGESSAEGWNKWNATRETSGSSPANGTISRCNSLNPYEIWQFHERESDKCLFMPTRASNMDEDDPYSTILFVDVRPFLFRLRSAKGQDMFRLIWLSFLGLHIPGLSSSLSATISDDRWADTTFMRPEFMQELFPMRNARRTVTADSFAGVVVGREKTYKISFDIAKAWSLGVIEPLEGLSADGQYRMWRRGYMQELDCHTIDAIGCIFKQVRQETEDLDWDVLNLAFKASSSDPRDSLKHSQNLLSQNSSSPELLATHARLECISGKYDKARKVYRIGLSSLTQGSGPGVVCLWWGSAELEWLLSQSDAALKVILRATGQSDERIGMQILRARHWLENVCREDITPEWKFRLKWIKLRILFELITGTLETTIAIGEGLQAKEAEGGLHHESLTVASLLMVYHHTVTLHNHAPPALLRALVRKALEIYPSNSIVLGLFLECEKGEGIWGRVRALMNENGPWTLQEKSLARRLSDMWIANWEEGRWFGEVERVRAGLEAAVSCGRTKGSAILWKIFVAFEITAGNLKRAKMVLFRALGECPFVKELYLLAFGGDLRSAFSSRELMSLSDAMAERGIRLRKSLVEMLEADGCSDDGDAGEDNLKDEDEDELEHDSRELRRLMPY